MKNINLQKLLSWDSVFSLFLLLILKFFYIKLYGIISYLVIFLFGNISGIIIYLVYYLFSKTNNLKFHLEIINRLFLNIMVISLLFVILIKLLFYMMEIGVFNVIYCEDTKPELTVYNLTTKAVQQIVSVSDIGGAAVFGAGLTAGSKVISKSSLPLSFKLGFSLSSGTASYFTFKLSNKIWNVSENNNSSQPENLELKTEDGKSFDVNLRDSGGTTAKSFLDENSLIGDYLSILEDSFYLQLSIFILTNLTIIFYIYKSLSEMKIDFTKLENNKYFYWLVGLIQKILSYWRKTSFIFFYLGLFFIWFFTGFNTYVLYFVLDGLTKVLK